MFQTKNHGRIVDKSVCAGDLMVRLESCAPKWGADLSKLMKMQYHYMHVGGVGQLMDTRALIVLCALFEPVTPAKMAEMALNLGVDGIPTLEESRSLELAGRRVSKGKPLFPRIEPSWAV